MGPFAGRIPQLVGRDRQLAEIDRFHRQRADGSAALVIGGEPGSGRTALLEATAAGASSATLVLQARPRPEETSLPFGALRDLLADVHDPLAARLPPPLRESLAAALLIRHKAPDADPSLVPPALAAALDSLARETPVLLVIDDVEWLDADSRRAVLYALNRLPDGVSLALVHGHGVDPRATLSIERAVPMSRLVRIEADSLSAAAVRELLVRTVGSLSRAAVNEIVAQAGGNVRASLELGRAAVDRGNGDDAGGYVPRSVEALVERRIGRLAADAERATRLIAVAGRLSVRDFVRLESTTKDALERAEAAGAVVEADGVLRTSSALVTTVVLARSTPAAVRAAHAALAAIATAPDDRARHLAGSPEARDHVSEIEAGADFALRRGAASAAAELYELAARLSSDSASNIDRARRLRSQARALLAAGDAATAREVAETAIDTVPVADRPRMIADLADIAWADGSIMREARRAREALARVSDPGVRLDLMTALVAFGVASDPASAMSDADAALELVGDGDVGRRGYLLIHRQMASALAGRGVDWERLREGVSLEDAGVAVGQTPSSPPLVLFTMCDRADEARARFAFEDAWYAARGEDGWRAERAGQLALVELRAGNASLARYLADHAADRLDRLQVGGAWPLVYAWRSLVDAHTGRAQRAVATVDGLLEEVSKGTLWAAIVRSVGVLAAHAAGDDIAALAHAASMRSILDSIGVADLLADRSEPLLAELLAAVGDVAGAEQELARLEQRHATLPRPWTATALVRTRAVVLAANDDMDQAVEAASDPAGDDPSLPFETAWNTLLRGRVLRRVRDRRRAADALRSARERFERLGATPWAEQASAELARVGLRRRPADQLTDGELAIARLAGLGLTTREIADRAFVSLKTVEANLTRIYRKLGIRSRAELGAWLERRGGPET
jgi:DNA-binding CsgD family transcriptional regulator